MDLFNKSLIVKKGKIGEFIAKFYLKYIKHEKVESINNDYRFDFLTDSNTYEIKCDSQYKKFNSFYIEFQSGERKSGIHTTQAITYIIIGPYELNNYLLVEITTNKLKEIISTNKLKIAPAACYDYKDKKTDSYNLGYILPFEIIKDCSTIINFNESHEKYNELLNYLKKNIVLYI